MAKIDFETIGAYALGTTISEAGIADHFDIDDVDDITEALLDANIERCEACEWWVESHELLDEDDNPIGICFDCR